MVDPVRPSLTEWVSSLAIVTLAATWPLADFIRSNEGQYLPVGRLAVYGVIALAVSLTVVAVLGRRDGAALRRTAVVAVWVLAAFFHFNIVFEGGRGVIWRTAEDARPLLALLVWLVVVGVGARVFWALSRHDGFRLFVTIFVVALWVTNMVGAAAVLSDADTDPAEVAEAVPGAALESRPNIYHFILDQYPRADVAASVIGADIGPFQAELAERGFWVGARSYSAYPATVTSIPAVLEADYLVVTPEDATRSDEELSAPMLGGAAVVQELRAAGYQYVYASAGHDYWGSCRGDLIDVCLSPEPKGAIRTEAEQVLIWRTPLSTMIDTSLHYTRPAEVLDALDDHRDEVEEPFLLFAHLLVPHEPFEYGPDCVVRDRPKEGRTEVDYANELDCLNRELLEVADRIRAEDPTAVILFQADHGTAFGVTWADSLDEWSPDLLRQRFAVFDARLGPEGCPPPAQPDVIVNTYPWLLGCLRGEAPEYREPRAFLWRYGGYIEEIPDPFAAFGEASP